MSEDLKRAYESLWAKQQPYNLLWDYYDGDHPLRYSHKRLKEVFQGFNARFHENWAAVVVDSVIERITLRRFNIADQKDAETELNQLVDQTELLLDANDLHLAAIVCGESYLILWADELNKVQAFYHDPRNAHVFYNPENPKEKLFGCKWFIDEKKRRVVVLYYPERVEYWISKSKYDAMDQVYKSNSFDLDVEKSGTHLFGEVPVFHFQRTRRKVLSELKNVLPIQDAINKLVSDLMVTAEFQAFPQRWAITQATIGEEKLKSRPGGHWEFPAGDGVGQGTAVGQFPEARLDNFLQAIEQKAAAVAAITRTPKHYFFQETGSAPSGEALIAMEAPLNKKTQNYIDLFAVRWKQVARFILKVTGKSREIEANEITPVFDAVETVQPFTRAQIRQTNVNAGIPIVTQLRMEGWSDEDIAKMQEESQAMNVPTMEQDGQVLQRVVTMQEESIKKASELIAPAIESAVQSISDLALDHLIRSGALERLTEARVKET